MYVCVVCWHYIFYYINRNLRRTFSLGAQGTASDSNSGILLRPLNDTISPLQNDIGNPNRRMSINNNRKSISMKRPSVVMQQTPMKDGSDINNSTTSYVQMP